MRSLFLLVSVIAVAAAPRAYADGSPLLSPPPLVAPPVELHDAPAGGLHATLAPPLTCSACAVTEAAGVTAFVFGYLGSVALWLHSEDVISHPTTGSWAAIVFVPLEELLALGELVPVLGPILGATLFFNNEPGQVRWAWADAGVQAAGLTLAAVGALTQNQFQKAHRLTVAPLVRPNASGVLVGGTF